MQFIYNTLRFGRTWMIYLNFPKAKRLEKFISGLYSSIFILVYRYLYIYYRVVYIYSSVYVSIYIYMFSIFDLHEKNYCGEAGRQML